MVPAGADEGDAVACPPGERGVVPSLPPGAVTGAELADWIRGHWKIEKLLHHVRDRTFPEFDSKIHAGLLPCTVAGLRNLAIGVHRQDGHTNIAAAPRRTARDWRRLLARHHGR